MAGVPRLMVTNLIQATATTLAACSSATGSPVSRLRDQLRSKTWRSATGWVVSFRNNKIDFNRGGVKVATIASGTYATGALLAAAIVTALEAADATPVWACTYDAGTKKFTISSDLAFTLLFGSGANPTVSVHADIGFASSDTASAVTHTGGTAVSQSRKAIIVDLGSAQSFTAGIVINHNMGTGGTVSLDAAASGFDVGWGFGAATFRQTLAGDAAIRVAYFASQSYRYLRLLLEDQTNVLGYSEVGIFFAGVYVQPTVSYAIGLDKKWDELSEVTVAVCGAHFQDEKARRPTWSLQWSEAPTADRTSLAAAFALVPKGRCFFFAFDAVTTPADTEYVFIPEGVGERLTSGSYYDIPVALAGALG